jgi:hypothetical protein
MEAIAGPPMERQVGSWARAQAVRCLMDLLMERGSDAHRQQQHSACAIGGIWRLKENILLLSPSGCTKKTKDQLLRWLEEKSQQTLVQKG